MDEATFRKNKDTLAYIEENIRNYYFKKRYQRYNPSPEALNVFSSIQKSVNVIVLAARNCPICIASIPVILRLQLDVGNPNIDIRIIEESSPSLPDFLVDKKSPFIVFYDGEFNELFSLDQKDIKDNFENSLVEELRKIDSDMLGTDI
ncbi:MAG: thioredoxin family protein [Candidatus Methanofastidiosa archaeon]|nr:thioredoxin family protein [Candidatus Methanofastidiosa archaeon]